MITLIKRQTVFEKYKNIAGEISEIQNAFFDDDLDSFENEKERIKYAELFDIKDVKFRQPKKFYNVISFEHSDIKTFTNVLSLKLVKLLSDLNINNLVMLAHLEMSLIGNRSNTYTELQTVFKNFENITNDPIYNQALITDLDELPKLLEIAFWIGRCDASAPEFIFFYDEDEKFAFSICKEGNIHTIEIENKLLSPELLNDYEFEFINGQCLNKFSSDSKIEGRQNIVD